MCLKCCWNSGKNWVLLLLVQPEICHPMTLHNKRLHVFAFCMFVTHPRLSYDSLTVPFCSHFLLLLDSFDFKCDKMVYHFIKLIICIEKVSYSQMAVHAWVYTPFQIKWQFLWFLRTEPVWQHSFAKEKKIRTKKRLEATKIHVDDKNVV